MHKPDVLSSVATDPEIIGKITAGEKDYFEILIRRYNGVLYKIGRSYGLAHDDVQDLMQETHIAAFLNLGKFEERSTYKTWLIRIMLNKCYHWAQKKSLKADGVFSEASHTGAVLTAEAVTFSDARKEILNRELGLVLETCIEKLPPDYRTVFVLRELEGLSVQETAEATSISEANVKVRLNRAKAMLRKQLESWYPQAQVYEFNLIYCDKVVEKVFENI
ncbi:sigma-70 family RNA polymerase sigma factor [Adhaeribacter soli]|uniref:Sigma-70 family RNA polymerase sigma factor n=1 Tax=Adhaeribacter soli TaxID=2607655 RepID=A0A5N1IP93_9BACT|nr:sigma-70 family RNA polymerase sigma factor [Adhaeribacter soli]KAA9331781.1 sigma-70 family RNA polymerase sigma factor [Adhaeribacter soli]